MRDLIEPGQAKQLLRSQQFQSEQTLAQKLGGQPARFGKRGQQQGVAPHRKATEQPGHGAVAGAAFPVNAAKNGGRKLGHCGERDQADSHQGVGVARSAKVDVAQQQNRHNRPAANAQQQTGEVLSLVQAQGLHAQGQRHHQVVADHGGQRNRLHNHHAGGGRQTTDEHEQGQSLVAQGHRQGQHKSVGIHIARREVQHAGQGNRQHEDVDQQQVQREQPDRLAQVLLIDVFHHRDLELAWQQHDREHGENGERPPTAIAVAGVGHGHERLEFGHQLGARKDVAKSIEDAEGDKQTHGQEGQQLDHGLECNGCHHTFMPLGGVQMPRAKQEREGGQDRGDVQRAVLPQRLGRGLGGHDDIGVVQQNRETVGDRLQLQ